MDQYTSHAGGSVDVINYRSVEHVRRLRRRRVFCDDGRQHLHQLRRRQVFAKRSCFDVPQLRSRQGFRQHNVHYLRYLPRGLLLDPCIRGVPAVPSGLLLLGVGSSIISYMCVLRRWDNFTLEQDLLHAV